MITLKRALISVHDKSNLDRLAGKLIEAGVEILATGSTYAYLKQHQIPATLLSDYTKFPEIIHGRVKTLHPKVFGGILARSEHHEIDEINALDISKIDLVVVNLYPFKERAEQSNEIEALCDEIDIGGVALIRAAAKNFRECVVLSQSSLYDSFLEEFEKNDGKISQEFSKACMKQAFFLSSQYDWSIFAKFSELDQELWQAQVWKKQLHLRYGENPQQAASYWINAEQKDEEHELMGCDILHGKALSYNNLLDISAGLSLIDEFNAPACAIYKHTNPCGTAMSESIEKAFQDAYDCDPISAFGGIYFFNREVTMEIARQLSSKFFEIITAPSYHPDALALLKEKKNLRILLRKKPCSHTHQIRSLYQGYLIQEKDRQLFDELKTVAGQKPDPSITKDILFGLTVCKHLKSNAIVLVKNTCTVGMGMGQCNRVKSARHAIEQAGEHCHGAILVSDGFLPFSDTVTLASEHGISLIVEPGGSVKDEEVIKVAKEKGISLIFTGIRHFMH